MSQSSGLGCSWSGGWLHRELVWPGGTGHGGRCLCLPSPRHQTGSSPYSYFSFCFPFSGSSKIEEACEIYARAANMFKMAKNWSGMWSLPGMPSIPFPSSLSFLSLRPGSPFPFNAISSITNPSACRLVILGHWVILQLGSQGFGGRT